MPSHLNDLMDQLPPEYPHELLPDIREHFMDTGKTIVVFDDDPTGTQTSYDVTVLTAWTIPLLADELRKKPSILFILTNSRSMSEQAAIQLTWEIGQNLKQAVKESGQGIIPISRSDSTLRGHFPAEVSALARSLELEKAVWVLIPAFIEGGRYTIGDVHYIKEQQELIPVASTPFAKDKVFGYSHSNLKEWVEEKTKGDITANQVVSVSLEDIRVGGPQSVYEKLLTCRPGQVCIVNACSVRDLEVFAMEALLAEKAGISCLYRTSATFVPIRAGIAPGKIFQPEQVHSPNGSLVIVGSHVPKTTSQLEYLLAKKTHAPLEVNVKELLQSSEKETYANSIIQQTNQWLASGKDVIIYTSRQLEVGKDAESNLQINTIVSAFLVRLVQGLTIRPAYIVAKGGITSSDLATKGLGTVKALILGQIIPGVPVWQLDEQSKFPGMLYIVFPGNVGDHSALAEVCDKIRK
jgi:uncharacterized protein YgbK (DUF1537 family)